MVYGFESVLGDHTHAPPPPTRAECAPQARGCGL